MAGCADKQYHATEREALNHLRWARKQPSGHRLRSLNVYPCPDCDGWHVGRAWRGKREWLATQPRPAAAPAAAKPRSLGAIRRKLARLEKQWDRQRRYRAAGIGKLVARDLEMWRAEEELREAQRMALELVARAERL
jgi:hypothetical protein